MSSATLETREQTVNIARTIRLAVRQGMPFPDAFAQFAAETPQRDEVIDRIWWNLPEAMHPPKPPVEDMLQMLNDCAERGDIETVLYGAAHWVQSGACYDHQTSSHRCGCLEEDRRTHCFTCGSRKSSDGYSMVCLLCDWDTVDNDADVEELPKCPNPECRASRVSKSYVGFDYYCYGCSTTF